MLDPMVSAALTVYSNPGIYALLLGSGVSRASGIPTGWDITLDLIRKVAAVQGQDADPDPEAWYVQTYGQEPNYSLLLDQVARSGSERCQLLKSYFEPSEEEREQGRKLPTRAHNAIAQLVAGGYVRVIVTTNFDRLVENALEAAGIRPAVISTADAVAGAMPLTHSPCTVIKVHGDYMDLRIRNTPDELAQYDARLDTLLDQVFDEYGLVVCGWSARWDVALRSAIERCASRRFTTFWVSPGAPDPDASRLIDHRRAAEIRLDADSFFTALVEKVTALRDIERPHPLSAKMAAATAKRYLADPQRAIDLHDLAVREAESVYQLLQSEDLAPQGSYSDQELYRRVARLGAAVEPLAGIFALGCYWGGEDHLALWRNCLRRLGNPPGASRGVTAWLHLMAYPAFLVLYAGGIGAVAAAKYPALKALLVDTRLRQLAGGDIPAVLALTAAQVLDSGLAQRLPGLERHRVPLNDHSESFLRPVFAELIPDEGEYRLLFDRFEYLAALVHADLYNVERGHRRAPLGCFGWRAGADSIVAEELERMGEGWPPLTAGLFEGSLERAIEAHKTLQAKIHELGWR